MQFPKNCKIIFLIVYFDTAKSHGCQEKSGISAPAYHKCKLWKTCEDLRSVSKKTKEKSKTWKFCCQNKQKGNACHVRSDEKNLKTVLFLCKDLTKK